MTKLSPPPTYELIADQVTGKATLPWLLFFDGVFTGDQGQAWAPTITGLTVVGSPVITGQIYQVGALCYFWIEIVPATNTSSTNGTTYANNFPLQITSSTSCSAVTNAPSTALGMCDSATNRIYFPSWSAITSPITISGFVVAS